MENNRHTDTQSSAHYGSQKCECKTRQKNHISTEYEKNKQTFERKMHRNKMK